jgi:hypothetical protein
LRRLAKATLNDYRDQNVYYAISELLRAMTKLYPALRQAQSVTAVLKASVGNYQYRTLDMHFKAACLLDQIETIPFKQALYVVKNTDSYDDRLIDPNYRRIPEVRHQETPGSPA